MRPVSREGATRFPLFDAGAREAARRRIREPGGEPMKLHPLMEEAEFVRAVHESFYFPTDREYEEAARVGCAISDNAALTVGYELAMGASFASPECNLHLLEILERERPTPVILAAIPVLRSLLGGEPVDGGDTLRLLAACREHSNAWSGLGIVLCADPGFERECDEIMAAWRSAGKIPGRR